MNQELGKTGQVYRLNTKTKIKGASAIIAEKSTKHLEPFRIGLDSVCM